MNYQTDILFFSKHMIPKHIKTLLTVWNTALLYCTSHIIKTAMHEISVASSTMFAHCFCRQLCSERNAPRGKQTRTNACSHAESQKGEFNRKVYKSHTEAEIVLTTKTWASLTECKYVCADKTSVCVHICVWSLPAVLAEGEMRILPMGHIIASHPCSVWDCVWTSAAASAAFNTEEKGHSTHTLFTHPCLHHLTSPHPLRSFSRLKLPAHSYVTHARCRSAT